ncbi:MAG: hypothetical protein AABZ23_04545 [Deltaproteobacteria bacterium]
MTEWFVLMLLLLIAAALVLNLPFGYFRAGAKKFSLKWFLYIHLPIPFIFLLRRFAGIGAEFIPIIAAGAIAGQLIGGRLGNRSTKAINP